MVMGAAEKRAVLAVIDAKSPFRYYGPHLLGKVQRFERAFAKFAGVRYALGVTSGTAALRVAIEALEIGPGDEVIVPAVTFYASPNAVVCARAVPIFADVDESLGIDPADFERKITRRTKAVMPVPILGVSPAMDRVRAVARKHRIAVIEDVAQSCGATFKDRVLGSFGDVSTFSLQLNKIITAGEGGVVVTSDPILYERAVRYHDQGQVRKPHADLLGKLRLEPFAGENYRMSEIAGAIAAAQLAKLPSILKKMRAARAKIEAAVKPLKRLKPRPSHDHAGDAASSVTFFLDNPKDAAWFVDALRAENLAAFRLYDGTPAYMFPQILGKGVASRVKCPYDCPRYTGKVDYHKGLCPNAEDLLARTVAFGLTPILTAADVNDMIAGIRKVYGALYEG
jgi:8-amino-3,8-dideoxy-alpha-D-manno-octulosonate transaminase